MDEGIYVQLNQRVNIDDLFAATCERGLVETVTPFKMAMYILFRVIDVYNEVSLPSGESHARVCSTIYGLLETENVTFKELCAAIHTMDRSFPNILKNFLKRVNMHMGEDEVHMPWDQVLHRRMVGCQFVTTKSLLSQFIQRLAAGERTLTHRQQRKLHREFVSYVKGEAVTLHPALQFVYQQRGFGSTVRTNPLPGIISTGAKSRRFLLIQLHILQVSPCERHPDLEEYCRLISEAFPSINSVHLVLMMLAILRRDSQTASKELRTFVDYSVLRTNDYQPCAMQGRTPRLMITDNRIFKYSALLHGRLHRIFGNKSIARQMLHEAVAGAHMGKHRTCSRFTLVECAAVDIMPEPRHTDSEQDAWRSLCVDEPSSVNKKSLESQQTGASCLTSPFLRKLLADAKEDSEARRETDEGRELSSDPLEQRMLIKRLIESGRLVSAMAAHVRKNLYIKKQRPTSPQQAAQSTGPDPWGKTRQLVDAETAFMSSIKLSSGLVTASRTVAWPMLSAEHPDAYATTHATVSQAVAAANVIYSFARECKWLEAKLCAATFFEKYIRPGAHWQVTRVIERAQSLVHVDEALLKGDWLEAEKWLIVADALCREEATIRRAFLLCGRGLMPEALELLNGEIYYLQPKFNMALSLRFDMLIALMMTRVGLGLSAMEILDRALTSCKNKGLHPLRVALLRRKALVQMSVGKYEEAYSLLKKYGNSMEMYGEDPSAVLCELTSARESARTAGCIMLEKAAVAAACVLLEGDQLRKMSRQLMDLERECDKNIDWTVI